MRKRQRRPNENAELPIEASTIAAYNSERRWVKVESGAALILRALCWSSVTSGIPRKALERTRSVANTVPSYQKVRVQSVSQSGDRESGVGGSVASHNSFVSNSDSSAGGTSDMKYQKCKIYIVITVINRTQTNV